MTSYLLDLPNLTFFETGCNTFESIISLTIDSNMIILTEYSIDLPKLATIIGHHCSFNNASIFTITSRYITSIKAYEIDLPELTKIKLTSCVADKATTVTFSSMNRIILFQ